MASSALRRKHEHFSDQRSSSESAALRLAAAERPEEILPILLEEVVHLGFPRALALELDFDTGQITPSASLNCSPEFLQQFSTSLWASENPSVSALINLKSVLSPNGMQLPTSVGDPGVMSMDPGPRWCATWFSDPDLEITLR